jgi:hypothetical protein
MQTIKQMLKMIKLNMFLNPTAYQRLIVSKKNETTQVTEPELNKVKQKGKMKQETFRLLR